MADVAPIAPKNELYAGHLSFVIKPIFDLKKKKTLENKQKSKLKYFLKFILDLEALS